MRFKLVSPLFSLTANAVIENLTPRERKRFIRRAIGFASALSLMGFIAVSIVLAVFGVPAMVFEPMAGIRYQLPSSTQKWLLIASGFLAVFTVGSLYWLRSQRRFLASTQWAATQGSIVSPLPMFRPVARYMFVGGFCTCALFTFAGVVWPWLPGTFHYDDCGFPRGTGWDRAYYKSGSVMREEYYSNGQLEVGRWFRPNGDLVDNVAYVDGAVSYGNLREDGSIIMKMECKRWRDFPYFVADGKTTFYRQDGTVEREETYREGQLITSR